MTKRDYYEVLGLQKGAGADEIKRAYRKLAMQYHPDRNKDDGATERFKEISEAYAVLADEKKKATYDQYGHAGFDRMYSQEDIFRNADFSDFQDMFSGFGGDPFSDMFGSMFGFGGRRGRRRNVGADLRTDIGITLEEAAKGVKKDIDYHHSKSCSKCSGTGGEPGSKVTVCHACGGNGQVQQARRVGPMQFYTVNTCEACRGAGKSYERSCPECGGSGKVSQREHLKVDIPAGVHTGMKLRLEGLGEYGNDGPGDLYVVVYVKDHKRFEREGDDIFIEVPVGFPTLAMGGEIEVPTLFGSAKLKIPSGTASHTLFRLRGEGIPHIEGHGKGDEMVRVVVDVPKKLSKRQKEALEEFEGKENGKRKGWFG